MENSRLEKEKAVQLRANETKNESMSLVSKIRLLAQFVLNNPQFSWKIAQLKQMCKEEDLLQGKGIYADYFLAWNNPHIQQFENANLEMLTSLPFLESLCEQGLKTEKNEYATNKMREAMSFLVKEIDFDTLSQENLQNALAQSEQENKKLVFLCNHMSHLDAPTLDFVFHTILSQSQIERVRFVTGAFMYYNKHVRPFTRAFDTLFVFGPADFSQIQKDLFTKHSDRAERKAILQILGKLKDKSVEELAKVTPQEVCLLFPYAGRADNAIGCKESIPNGLADALSQENVIYVPFGFVGTRDMMPHNPGGGGDTLKNFANITPQNIAIRCQKAFVWGERNMQEIHETMIWVSSLAYNAKRSLT